MADTIEKNEPSFVYNDDDLNPIGRLFKMIKGHSAKTPKGERKRKKKASYAKYGYIFLIPFFLGFAVFNLLPLGSTVYYSFFEYYYKLGLTPVGPNFVGFANYGALLTSVDFWYYLGNTIFIWILGFIPQLIVSLLLAIWFTDARLKLKFAGFFKAVAYMPNLVMASAFGMLFLMLFGNSGPINQILEQMGQSPYSFLDSPGWTRGIIALINWIMWFGNTTLLLMSGIMGIDESVFESARLDGASSTKTFWTITMPLLMPIFVYVLITSMIGGIQLFDAAQIFTETKGGIQNSGYTIMMYLYKLINYSKNYGMAGAVSVLMFILTGLLSIVVFRSLVPHGNASKLEEKARRKRLRMLASIEKEEIRHDR